MTYSADNEDMHHEVEWLQPSDRPILEELAEYGGWMTPLGLSLNLPYTSNWVGQRLRTLVDHDLVERHDEKAGYRITNRGHEFLSGHLQAEDLID